METTVSFTGYRTAKMPRPVSQTEIVVKRALVRLLPKLYDEGYRTFMSGMADGFDMWAAETVLSMKEELTQMQLTAVVPFSGHSERFSADLKARYDRIIRRADRVITLSDSYDKFSYYRRNDYLVEQAGMIVTCFDGQAGGTKYTLSRASQKGVKIINLLTPEIAFND